MKEDNQKKKYDSTVNFWTWILIQLLWDTALLPLRDHNCILLVRRQMLFLDFYLLGDISVLVNHVEAVNRESNGCGQWTNGYCHANFFCSVEGHFCKFDVVRDLFKPQRVTDSTYCYLEYAYSLCSFSWYWLLIVVLVHNPWYEQFCILDLFIASFFFRKTNL